MVKLRLANIIQDSATELPISRLGSYQKYIWVYCLALQLESVRPRLPFSKFKARSRISKVFFYKVTYCRFNKAVNFLSCWKLKGISAAAGHVNWLFFKWQPCILPEPHLFAVLTQTHRSHRTVFMGCGNLIHVFHICGTYTTSDIPSLEAP